MAVKGRALSLLVHADTKVGKSTLGITTPAPRLLFDAEAAHRFLPIKSTFWEPMTGPPPVPDGTWDTCVVVVRDYATLVTAVQYLELGQHYFESVVFDSISEIQKKCKDQITSGSPQMDQRLWGELLWHMEALIRRLRDLTAHPTNPITALLLTAMTEQRDGKWRPYVQGQLRTTLPYFIDVVGYMFVKPGVAADPTQAPPPPTRCMLTRPHPQFEAGERVQGRLPEYVEGPYVHVGWMLDAIFGPLSQPEQPQNVAENGQATAKPAVPSEQPQLQVFQQQ